MHQVPRPILTSGSRVASTIKDLQGVFNKGPAERRDSSGSQAPPIAPRGIRTTPPPRQDTITTKQHGQTNGSLGSEARNNGNMGVDARNNGNMGSEERNNEPRKESLGGESRKLSGSSDTRKISSTSISLLPKPSLPVKPVLPLSRIGGNNNEVSKTGENGALRREPTAKVSVVSIDKSQDKPALVKDHMPLINNNKEEVMNNMGDKFCDLEILPRKSSTYEEDSYDDELMNDQLIEEELNKQNIADMGNGEKKSLNGLNGLKIYDCKSDAKSTKAPVKTIKTQKPAGFVGFASLPEQVYRKALRKGFEFTLMVVGESGLGKSTLVNSMFLTDIYSSKFPGAIPRVAKTLDVETHKVLLEEGGVKLSLTVVDTPGFGDAVDNSGCWEPVTNFVEKQFEKFLEAETRVNRVELPDNRVHVCLYFIAPSGHGLKPLDIEFMSRLHDKVNIIPVIGKADACTTEEVQFFKEKILQQLNESKIKIYSFPEGEDGTEDWMRKRIPFAVVGSNTVIEEEGGKRVRGRKYPWGTVNIENKDHCDFLPLRTLLLAHHMQDLKDVTNYVHYENFRCRRLTGVLSPEDGGPTKPNKNPLAALEDDQKDHKKKVERMKSEMEEVFDRKVDEKEQKLKESERELEERLEDSKDKLEEQKREQEKQKLLFEKEKRIWESTNAVSMDELTRRQSMETLVSSKKKRYGIGMMTFKIGK